MSEETTPAPAAPPGPEAALRERVGALLGPGAVPDHAGALSAWRVAPEALREACRTLRDAGFEYLMFVTAADRPAEGRFELLYVLARYDAAGEVALLTDVDRAAPAIDTVSDLWAAADWHEREVYDLFGVVFRNHPFLRRILLDEDWPGHPLRKDYVDTVHDVVRRPT